MNLPRLTGARVSLVPVPLELAVAVCAGWPGDAALPASAATSSLTAADGWPHDDTAEALQALADHGRPGDDGGWLVLDHDRVVGECGWRGGPDADGTVELSYGLAAPARGQGLGTEAVGLLTAWAELQPGVRRVTARVRAGNHASLRLLRRLGFREQPDEPPWVLCVRDAAHPARPLRVTGRHVC